MLLPATVIFIKFAAELIKRSIHRGCIPYFGFQKGKRKYHKFATLGGKNVKNIRFFM